MMEYKGWVAKEEAARETGLSVRQLNRKIEKGLLRQEYRQIPNRKPLPILHPDDVAQLRKATLQPVPGPKRHEQDVSLFVPIAQKLFLNLKEAVAYSGLPRRYLLYCVQRGIIEGAKLGGWKIRRFSLLRHQLVTVPMMSHQQRLLQINQVVEPERGTASLPS